MRTCLLTTLRCAAPLHCLQPASCNYLSFAQRDTVYESGPGAHPPSDTGVILMSLINVFFIVSTEPETPPPTGAAKETEACAFQR